MIEVQRIGEELVGFYRSERPIGEALLVDENQMATAYEKLESDRDRLVARVAELEAQLSVWKESAQVKNPLNHSESNALRWMTKALDLEEQLDLLAERHNEQMAILEKRISEYVSSIDDLKLDREGLAHTIKEKIELEAENAMLKLRLESAKQGEKDMADLANQYPPVKEAP